MGRIEYEYPLFKVYYSNNLNIRGNPDHTNIVRCRHQVLRPCEAAEVGTTGSVTAPVAGDRGQCGEMSAECYSAVTMTD